MNRRPTTLLAAVLLIGTALMVLPGCGAPASPKHLTSFTVAAASVEAALATSGIASVSRAVLVFNGVKPGLTLDHPALHDGALDIPLDGQVCYGSNHVEASLEVTYQDGHSGTAEAAFDFWFAPATPTVAIPTSVQGVAGEPIALPVQITSGADPGFAYACSAVLTVSIGATDLPPITLPVPGTGSVELPAMTSSGSVVLGTKLVLGAATRSADKVVSVGLLRPAHLTLKVSGVAAAPVLVSQGSATVFSETVTGQTVVDLAPGTYLVDGLPVSGYVSPDAQEISLAEGQAATVELSYTAGPPPPADVGITLVAPVDGATITDPQFDVTIDVADPSKLLQLQALFVDKGILPGAAWTVIPSKTRYSVTVVLNPDLYNGPHTLLVRAQTTSGSWVDGATADITIDVPWLGAAYLDYEGFPASQQLYPNRTVTLSGTVRSRNGFAGPGTLGAVAPAGVTVQVSPAQHNFTGGESLPVTVTIKTAADLLPKTYDLQLTWKDQYDLRSGAVPLALDVPNPLAITLSTPPSPLRAQPVALSASLPLKETDVSDVEFFEDGTSLGKDTSAPYTFSWSPGLLQNGEHEIRATVHSPYGYTASDSVTLDLGFPFGVRQQADAGRSLSLAPVMLDGAVFTAGDDRVVRVTPADLTLLTSETLGGTVRDLFAFGGALYAATDTALARLGSTDLAITPVSVGGSGYCCRAAAGSHGLVAFGNVVTSLDAGWTLDVGAPILALAADGNGLVVATPDRLLTFTPDGAGPVGRAANPYAALHGMASTGSALQMLDGTSLLSRPRLLNLLLDARAFDGAAWQATQLTVSADAVTDPDSGATADRVVPAAGLAAPDVAELVQPVAVVPGATYTMSFWYLPDGGAPPPSYLVRSGATVLVAATPYWTSAAPTGWTRVIATFTVPAGVTSAEVVPFVFDPAADPAVPTWPDGAGVALWAARLDYGSSAGADAPDTPLGALCGALTTGRHDTAWWLGDEAGCVTRVDGSGATQVWSGHAAAVQSILSVSTDRTLVAHQDGDLVAVSSVSMQALPVAAIPLGFAVNGAELVVPYADGTVRRLDGPVWP